MILFDIVWRTGYLVDFNGHTAIVHHDWLNLVPVIIPEYFNEL